MPETLLIIDDDEALVELLESYFTGLGYRVATARNGQEGLERFRAVQPDLVLLDVTMPKMDGWTALRRLRVRAVLNRVRHKGQADAGILQAGDLVVDLDVNR